MKPFLALCVLALGLCHSFAQKYVLWYDTLAEMQASNRNDPNVTAIVHGATTTDWSEWKWVAGDATTANGTTILASTHSDHPGGRWFKKTPDLTTLGGGSSDSNWTNSAGVVQLVTPSNLLAVPTNIVSGSYQWTNTDAGGNLMQSYYWNSSSPTVTGNHPISAISWGQGALANNSNTNLSYWVLAFGFNAMRNNSATGYQADIQAFGTDALGDNSGTSAQADIIAFGDAALYNNTASGNQQDIVAIGDATMEDNATTGDQRNIVAIGNVAMRGNSGAVEQQDQVAIGRSAFQGNSGGPVIDLIVFGTRCLKDNASSLQDVIAFGRDVSTSGAVITNSTAMGLGVVLTNSNEFHTGSGQSVFFDSDALVSGRLYLGATNASRVGITRVLKGSATLNFDLSAVTYQDLTIPVTGAAVGDVVSPGIPNSAIANGVSYTMWVSAPNTVTVRASTSTGTPNPASADFSAMVTQF